MSFRITDLMAQVMPQPLLMSDTTCPNSGGPRPEPCPGASCKAPSGCPGNTQPGCGGKSAGGQRSAVYGLPALRQELRRALEARA
jgi:hypothetical protein